MSWELKKENAYGFSSFVLTLICFIVTLYSLCNFSYFLQPIPAPLGHACVEVEGYWVAQGEMEPALDPSYVLTPSVKLNLRDLARVVSAG